MYGRIGPKVKAGLAGAFDRGWETTDEEQIVLYEIVLEALFFQSPSAQLVDELVMCVGSPAIFDLWMREEVVYKVTSLSQNFVRSCETNVRGNIGRGYGAKGRI